MNNNDDIHMEKWECAKFPMVPVYFPVALGDTIWIVDEKPNGEWVPVQTTVISFTVSIRNKTITTSNGLILDIDEDRWFFTEKSAKLLCNNRNDWLHTKHNP